MPRLRRHFHSGHVLLACAAMMVAQLGGYAFFRGYPEGALLVLVAIAVVAVMITRPESRQTP